MRLLIALPDAAQSESIREHLQHQPWEMETVANGMDVHTFAGVRESIRLVLFALSTLKIYPNAYVIVAFLGKLLVVRFFVARINIKVDIVVSNLVARIFRLIESKVTGLSVGV